MRLGIQTFAPIYKPGQFDDKSRFPARFEEKFEMRAPNKHRKKSLAHGPDTYSGNIKGFPLRTFAQDSAPKVSNCTSSKPCSICLHGFQSIVGRRNRDGAPSSPICFPSWSHMFSLSKAFSSKMIISTGFFMTLRPLPLF